MTYKEVYDIAVPLNKRKEEKWNILANNIFRPISVEMKRLIEDKLLADNIRHNAVAIRERLNPEKTAQAWLDYIKTIVK